MVRRKAAIEFLLADDSYNSNSKEMSQKELDMLTSVADGASSEGLKFWATAFTVKVLSDWGVSTSVWFRGCQCSHQTEKEQKQCPLKGRRGINLACGAWKSFIEDLNKLTLNKDALLAISKLEVLPGGQIFSAFLQRCFQDCKNKMELRARQAWTFWGDLPFSILELGRHYVDKTIDEGWSRRRALELISNFDACQSKTSLGAVSWVFFGDAVNRAHMFSWAQNGKPLAEHLRHLLLGYCTSLTVMQRLEARHHLVNLSLSRERALSVPGVISSLRRRANGDLTNPSFRASLQDLLNNVDQLVPEQWDSQNQLLEIVYGHGLDQLHPDTTWEEQQMQRIADQTLQSPPSSRLATCQSCSFVLAFQKNYHRSLAVSSFSVFNSIFRNMVFLLGNVFSSSQAVLQSEHLQTVFGSNDDQKARDVFAIPSAARDSSQQYIGFKVVSLHPDRRSYLQRAFALAQDDPSSDRCSGGFGSG